MRLRRLAAVVSWRAKKLAATAAPLTAEIARTSRSRIPRGTHLRIGAHEPVTGRANSLDRRRALPVGELPAEIPDVDVEDVGSRVVVVAPHGVQDLGAREHLVGMPHQVGEQLELPGRELHSVTGSIDLARSEVEADAPDGEGGRVDLARLAQMGPDPCQQFGERERLGQIVAGPEV